MFVTRRVAQTKPAASAPPPPYEYDGPSSSGGGGPTLCDASLCAHSHHVYDIQFLRASEACCRWEGAAASGGGGAVRTSSWS